MFKIGNKKADEIHEYYLKMEEIIQETINEESNELKLQLESKQLQLTAKDTEIQNIQKHQSKKNKKSFCCNFQKIQNAFI